MQEQQETARQAHEALHQRITQWREALLDGSVTAGPPSGDLRQLSASREALFAKITGFQPQEDQSRDLDNVMKEFHEVEEKLALHGSAVERPEDLQQLQRVRFSSWRPRPRLLRTSTRTVDLERNQVKWALSESIVRLYSLPGKELCLFRISDSFDHWCVAHYLHQLCVCHADQSEANGVQDLRELEDLQSMMQDSGAQLQEDMAQARSGICSTVEVIHENTMSLLHFFSEGGMEIPQKMSALAAKMAAQVAEADGGGYGPPLAARGLAAVLSGASTPMSASIAKVQDWQTNPSLLDSLSPGDFPFCAACSRNVILHFRGSLCSSDGAVTFRLSSHAADVMRSMCAPCCSPGPGDLV